MSSEVTSPFVGLRPFGEAEQSFFFGRERDISVIATNVIEEPLTVIYGPSGAGKSSVLQAGVLPHLKLLPNTAVVYFRNWQGNDFQEEIRKSVAAALGQPDPEGSLQEIVTEAGKQLFLMLDQFEEYLLYHAGEYNGSRFETTLARIVNSSDVRARVLIGLREDGLSRLNERFAIRIPDLLGNTLQVERLSLAAARNAIRKPLEVFSNTPQAEGKTFSIEDSLVEEILDQVQEGRAITSDSAGKGTRGSDAEAQIETAYLQLVLTKLWQEERAKDSTVLRLKTFRALGGANAIVRNHVRSVMESLGSDNLREIAARLFLYLVTPSRTKIAQRTEDLVTFGEAPEADVRQVLNTLAEQQETRILRRLSNPEQYEIFHDVLAQHILDWRRGYMEQKQQAEQERQRKEEADRKQRELEQARALAEQSKKLAEEQALRADEQARAALKLRHMVGILFILVMLAVAAAIYGLVEQRKAKMNAAAADRNAHAAVEAKKSADVLAELEKQSEAHAQETLFQLKAAQARQQNDQAAAQQYQQMAEDNRKKAEDAARQAQQQGSTALSTAQQLKKANDDLTQAKRERDDITSQRDTLASQVKALQQQVDELKKRPGPTESKAKSSQAQQSASPQAVFDSKFDPKDISAVWSPLEKTIDKKGLFLLEIQINNQSSAYVTAIGASLETGQKHLSVFASSLDPAVIPPRQIGKKHFIGAAEKDWRGTDLAGLSKIAKLTVELVGPNGKFTIVAAPDIVSNPAK